MNHLFRALPSMDASLDALLTADKALHDLPRPLLREAVTDFWDSRRDDIRAGRVQDVAELALEACLPELLAFARRKTAPRLRNVINGTGVVIHTNMGRSVLARSAQEAVRRVISGYCNLELDLHSGGRGSRYVIIDELLQRLTGAEAAMVVNNNAAAVLLVLDTFCKGGEVIVSRGELVEIGGSFRIPEVMEKLNPLFYWDRSNDNCTYRQKPICYIMDNKILSSTEVNMMLTEIDGLASIIISKGTGGVDDEIIQNTKMFNSNDVDVSELDKYSIFYLIPLPKHDVLNKHETAALGTRQTVMQGYTPALEYYSPAYIDKELYMDKADKRRTLYWNPTVQTDENGKAVIECYNNQYSTPLIIQAETLSNDGKLGSVTYSTVAETK